MNKIASMAALLLISTSALTVPPPQLREAVHKWAAPAVVTRFEYSLVDLNGDKKLDAVVRVVDADRCGNGGCVLLTFKATPDGYERVGDSGYVAKPIYVMKEVLSGWTSLAGVVGMGQGAGVRPIRYMGTEYRSNPIMRGQIVVAKTGHEAQDLGDPLIFEVAE